MNPVENKVGRSFKGAVLYYTHDKNALSDERVLFTHTENLPTDNPELAAKIMAYTHAHQRDIRLAAGTLGEGQRNRKTPKPVYSYCLTWHPEQDPTHEHMIEAARSSLEKLGLNEHEIIMAAHNDEPQPHIHIVANVIHPETGLKNDLKFTKRRLQEWALEYQRERGEAYSPQREENHRKRQENQKRREAGEQIYDRVKDRKSLSTAEFHRWSHEKTKRDFEQRQQETGKISRHHKLENDAVFNAKEQQIRQHRIDLKERHRPFWATIYKEQRIQRQELETAQATAWGRFKYYWKSRDPYSGTTTRTGLRDLISEAIKATRSSEKAFADLDRKHADRKKYLSERVNKTIRNDLKKINATYDRKLDALIIRQRQENAALKKRQSLQSQKEALDIVSGKRREEFDRAAKYKHMREIAGKDEKTAKKDFDRSSQQQPEKTKKAPSPDLDKREATRSAFNETKTRITGQQPDDRKKSDTEEKRQASRDAFADTKKDITGDRPMTKEEKRKQLRDAFKDQKKEITEDRQPEPKKSDDDEKGRAGKSGRSKSFTAFQDQAGKKKDRDRERDRDDDDTPQPPKPKKPPTPKR